MWERGMGAVSRGLSWAMAERAPVKAGAKKILVEKKFVAKKVWSKKSENGTQSGQSDHKWSKVASFVTSG